MLNDAFLIDAITQPSTHPSPSDPSTDDTFRGFNAALKAWFEGWLAVPVCSYFYMPQPACGQLIYSLRMLAECAKLFSSKDQLVYTSTAQSQASTSTRPPVNMSPSEQSSIGMPKPFSADIQNNNSVAAAGAEVSAQLGQKIEILGILEAMVRRLEAASEEISEAQGFPWKNDFWALAAKKLKTKRPRFEKWSEIVAEVSDKSSYSTNGPSANKPESSGIESSLARSSDAEIQSEQHLGKYQGNEQWASDVFGGLNLDEGFFFDWPCDWDIGRLDRPGFENEPGIL